MSSEPIKAISKYCQSDEVLRKMTAKALGTVELKKFSAKELAGGFCNAVYLVEANGEKYVVKIAPHGQVPVMSHEKDILKIETNMLSVFEEKINISAPKLVFYDDSCEVCKSDYFFMSFMEGRPLNTIEGGVTDQELYKIKTAMGKIAKKISTIKADYFGVPALEETHFDNNYEFIWTLFDMLYNDIEAKNGEVPGIDHQGILDLLETQKDVLNQVKEPVHIHTDTWEGNIMVKEGEFVGLIDYAAVLYGDPLMSHDFHDFHDNESVARKGFLEGYGKTEFTNNEKIRISFYTLWQRLGMIAERYYREYEDKNQYAWVLDLYVAELENLRKLIGQ